MKKEKGPYPPLEIRIWELANHEGTLRGIEGRFAERDCTLISDRVYWGDAKMVED